MFSLICKKSLHLSPPARSLLITYKFYGTKSVVESSNSFVVSYLVNTCGLAQEKAHWASKYLKFGASDRPDSVISFLKNHGFTDSQVSIVVQRYPTLLLCHPENTLLPKFEFFESLGFKERDLNHLICSAPGLLKKSLKNQLWPTVNFLKNYLSSPVKMIACMKRSPWVFYQSSRALMEDNIQVLKELGVDEKKIEHYVRYQPRLFMMDKDKFKKALEEVERLGFGPTKGTFLTAVHVFCSMSDTTWEKKIGLYKKWGLSEEEILETFRRNVWFLSISEAKISEVMDFLVNKMGFKSSIVLNNPTIIMSSLKKRLIPRSLVYRTLTAKGVLTGNVKLFTRMLLSSEEKFLIKFVKCYEEVVPELHNLYQLSLEPRQSRSVHSVK